MQGAENSNPYTEGATEFFGDPNALDCNTHGEDSQQHRPGTAY